MLGILGCITLCLGKSSQVPTDFHQAGREFVPKMLEKFDVEDDGQPAGLSAPQLLRKVKETRHSPQDLEELQNWALNAAIGEEKEFQARNRVVLEQKIGGNLGKKTNKTGTVYYIIIHVEFLESCKCCKRVYILKCWLYDGKGRVN